MQSESKVYPKFVTLFYANLTNASSYIETMVKRLKIILTSSTLRTILGIPNDDMFISTHNTWLDYLFGTRVLLDILYWPIFCLNILLTSGFLNFEMRVFHLVVSYILFPRSGSFIYFFIFDAIIMYRIKEKELLDLLVWCSLTWSTFPPIMLELYYCMVCNWL